MDNGNDGIFPTGQVNCKPLAPTSSNCYSTIPVLELNETNMTATLVTHYIPPPSFFTLFGGNIEHLPNRNIHVNFGSTTSGGIVQELNPKATQVLWQGATPSGDQFHTYRWPSPGVQW
jgi:arylsulfate sulfotransferase